LCNLKTKSVRTNTRHVLHCKSNLYIETLLSDDVLDPTDAFPQRRNRGSPDENVEVRGGEVAMAEASCSRPRRQKKLESWWRLSTLLQAKKVESLTVAASSCK
jgi:hypothetical protein